MSTYSIFDQFMSSYESFVIWIEWTNKNRISKNEVPTLFNPRNGIYHSIYLSVCLSATKDVAVKYADGISAKG